MINNQFADIILPLAVKGRFTYRIPDELLETLKTGMSVAVRFGGKKLCTGIVCNIHNKAPDVKNVKTIIEILNTVPQFMRDS